MYRAWNLIANRHLAPIEQAEIEAQVQAFLNSWAAHGTPLEAHSHIRFSRLVSVSVDEAKAMASGCSIDKLTAALKEISDRYGLDLLNRQRLLFRQGNEVFPLMLDEVAAETREGRLLPDAFVLNTWSNYQPSPNAPEWVPVGETPIAAYAG